MSDLFESSVKSSGSGSGKSSRSPTFGSPTFGSPTSGSPMSALDCLSPKGAPHRNFFGLILFVVVSLQKYPSQYFKSVLQPLPKDWRKTEALFKDIWFGLKELSIRDKGIDKGQYTEVQRVFARSLEGKTLDIKNLIYNGFASLEQKTSDESRQQIERRSRRKGKKLRKPNGGGGSTGIMPLSPADSLSPNGFDSWNRFEWEINEVPAQVAKDPVAEAPLLSIPVAKAPVAKAPESGIPVSDLGGDDSDTPSDWENEDC